MTEFRYFGKFNPLYNEPVPDDFSDDNLQMSEEEARSRFEGFKRRFQVIPDVDPATGFVPWRIDIAASKGKLHWYMVDIIGPEGLATETFSWEGLDDGRLFLQQIDLFDYSGEWSSGARNNGDWDFKVQLKIWKDRPASLRFDEKVNGRRVGDFTTAKIESPRVWRDGIGFGEWESLLDPQGMDDFVSGLGDSR